MLRLISAALVAAFFQNATGDFKISDNVDLVVLDVAVKNAHGAFVANLDKKNFKVWEDGHPRDIVHFGSMDVPVTIGLVVDNSGSMIHKQAEVITAGLAFAKESNPQDQFFVVNFNDSVVRGLPKSLSFTDNWLTLRDALYLGKPQGQTALYDAIAYSIRHLELSSEEKRTLIVVSDGRDNVSTTSLKQLLQIVEASRATIYTVGLFDPEIDDLDPGVLRKIANVSGGEFFEPKQLSEIGPVFQQISQEVRHRYTIGYVPAPSDATRQLRTVKVVAEAEGRKLKVKTRTTYTTVPLSQTMAAPGATESKAR